MNDNTSLLEQTNFPALRIIGDPVKGVTDIYFIFDVYIDLPTTDYDGMSDVPYFFVVRNTEYNIQYILIHNKAKSFGAVRNGLLRMGVSVPKGYRLMDGKNPYDLLMEVYHTMLRENMTSTDVKDEYQYKAQMCPPDVFEQILRKYPFEACRSVYREMKGSNPVLLQTDRVRDFMQDTQYTELQAYKEVIVSQQGQFPSKVSLSDIPRKPQYQLFVNNQQQSWPNDPWGEQPVTVNITEFDTRCFKVTPITFSLRAIVREGQQAPAGVVVDPEQETVHCTLLLQPLTKEIQLQLEGVEKADEQKVLAQLQYTVNGEQKSLTKQKTLRLVGKEIIDPFSISYTGDDYSYQSYEENDDKLKVLFKAKPKPVEKTYSVKLAGVKEKDRAQVLAKIEYEVAGVKRKLVAASFKLTGDEALMTPYFSYTGDNWKLQDQRLEDDEQTFLLTFKAVDKKAVSGVELWVVLPILCMSEKKIGANMEIYPSGDDSGLRFYKKLRFQKENGYWLSESFALPADKWEVGNKQNYHLRLKTSLGSFEVEMAIAEFSNEMQSPGNKKRRGFVLKEDCFVKKNFGERYRTYVLISLFVLLFVLGGLVGWFVRPSVDQKVIQPADSEQNVPPSGTANADEEKLQQQIQDQQQIQSAYARLSAKDLTFADVMQLDSLVNSHPEYVSSLGLDEDLINDYKKTVETILDWKTTKNTWIYTRFNREVKASRLNSQHKECVACLCGEQVFKDIDAVKRYFQAHPDEFQSFEDLRKLATIQAPSSGSDTSQDTRKQRDKKQNNGTGNNELLKNK